MEVFISWANSRSGAVAAVLRDWLPNVVNALRPWLSSSDIDLGTRWSTEVSNRLESSQAGIICLTPENVHSDWILFEAGALSKTVDKSLVCPLLIDLAPSDIKGPLAQFQATRFDEDGILKLLLSLNKGLGENSLPNERLEKAFKVWWPVLKAGLSTLPSPTVTKTPSRTDRDILEEILATVRSELQAPRTTVEDLQVVRRNVMAIVRAYIHSMVNAALEKTGDVITETTQSVVGEDLVFLVYSQEGRSFRFSVPRNLKYQTGTAEQLMIQLTHQLGG
jgi:hypothetical protein